MVNSANIQSWARVDIVLKAYDDPSSTKTLQFTNRPALLGDATYLPLLKSFSGLSLAVGQDGLPRTGSGSIVIGDQWESFGECRRVFDLFERYTPINQTVTVYRAIEPMSTQSVPSSWTLLYTGKIESYSKSKEEITFSVSNNLVESKITARSIDNDMAPAGFSVPDDSIGKTLPLTFGSSNSYVPTFSIAKSDTDKSIAYYAYRSQFGTQFIEGSGSIAIYAKNLDGVFVEVNPASVYSSSQLENNTSDPFGITTTSHGKKEFLCPLSTNLNGAIVTGLKWYCKGLNTGTTDPLNPAYVVTTGTIILTLYRRTGGGNSFGDIEQPQMWEAIRSVEIPKSDYEVTLQGSSDFWVYGVLEQAVVIEDDTTDYSSQGYYEGPPPTYAVGVYLTNYSGSGTTDFTSGVTAPRTSNKYYLYRNTTDGGGWINPGGSALPLIGIDVADWTYETGSTDSNGFSYKYISLSQQLRNSRKCDMQSLDLSASIPALKDDGLGTITGSANKLLYEPDEVSKLLGFTWNGSIWADGGIIDNTTFASLYSVFTSGSYQRSVKGFTEGSIATLDLLYEIAKEMSCFIVPLSNGKIALWPWGNTGSSAKTILDINIKEFREIEETGPDTVINNIIINYGKNFLNISDQWEASAQPKNYSGALRINKSTSGYYNSLLANSESLYGKREFEESDTNWIGDSTSATTRALYYILRHNHTHSTFKIVVPLFDNLDLKLMDLVDVQSVHLSGYFGTTSKARLPTYTGTEVDLVKGEYWRMASKKRCQIIGISNDYNAGEFPTLELELREIKPRHKNDPTANSIETAS